MTLYAVGDIHGFSAQLDRALALIEADGGPDPEIYFLGDYTDRGPDSRGVLDRLIAGRDEGRPWKFCKGNHDRMFQRFLEAGDENDSRISSGKSWFHGALGGSRTLRSYGLDGEAQGFLMNGGVDTLASYELGGESLSKQELARAARKAIPDAHRTFLQDLPLFHETDDLIFVHAGLRPGLPLHEQDEDDLLWIREGWLDSDADHGRLVIHGHTALDFPAHHGNRVNIDGGAGFGNPLVPVAIDGQSIYTLDERGRIPLKPRA